MIFVDRREGSAELAPLIKTSNLLVTLESGDVAFNGYGPNGIIHIGIERKVITDLLSSISSGRLIGHQLPIMKEMYDIVYLVIEGISKREKSTGRLLISRDGGKSFIEPYGKRVWTSEGIAHFLTSRENEGIRIRVTNGIQMTAHTIHDLYSYWNREWKRHKSHLAMHNIQLPSQVSLDPRVKGKPPLVRRIAKELSNIQVDRSLAVAEYFGSVQRMFEAEEEEWTRIPGIGKVSAKQAWKELHDGGTRK